MKVRCVNLKDKLPDSAWLTEGKEYVVLSIFIDQRKKLLFRLIGDDGRIPAIYDSQLFSIISSNIPQNWITKVEEGYMELSPETWSRIGFWEEYFEGESTAKKIFEEEREKIIKSDMN